MFLDIDGHRLFTLSFGTGPRTFLAHSAWIGNNEDWIATLAIMSRQWRTVAYDHRGTGETKVPVEAISAEALRDDIFRVMDALDIERCVLGGFSAGTSIVLRAALLHPERFEGLVLMNGAAGVQLPGVNPHPHPHQAPPFRLSHGPVATTASAYDGSSSNAHPSRTSSTSGVGDMTSCCVPSRRLPTAFGR